VDQALFSLLEKATTPTLTLGGLVWLWLEWKRDREINRQDLKEFVAKYEKLLEASVTALTKVAENDHPEPK